MPTTLFAAVSLLAPLQALLRRLASLHLPAGLGATPVTRARAATPAELASANASPSSAVPTPQATRPLRVLHVMDAKGGGKHGGRMVISGRMADVCAELDRMAALEAMPHPAGR